MEINLKDYISIAVTILTCGITIGVVKQTKKRKVRKNNILIRNVY